ncbi:TniB family NTP-binding protein [Caulobacter sp. LARHSG274]
MTVVPEDPFGHLSEQIRHLATADDAVRRAAISTDTWIDYPVGKAALDALYRLRDQPERMRMPSILFYAPPHMGKSALTWRCKAMHDEQAKTNPDLPGIVRMQAPPTVDERRFYQALLEAMGVRAPLDATIHRLNQLCVAHLRARRVRLLIIDEMQTILDQRANVVRVMLNTLKYLSNELRISIAGFGSGEALGLINADEHLAARFTVVALPSWTQRESWLRDVVAERIALFPLRFPTVVDKRLLNTIRRETAGRVGDYFDFLEETALLAIETGVERLTPELFEQGAKRRRSGFDDLF